MEAESPCAASDLAVARRELLSGNHRELDPVGLRQTWLDLHESWLIDKADEIGIADASGFAIVGVGGLGRRELLPYSDLDVLLLHDGKPADILRPVADRLWYPLWDANIRLDHSVRTVSEALTIANSLSEADSKATGPGVWSDWKASLVDDLVRRCRMVMAGESLPQAEPTAPHYLSLAADHGVHVEISPRDGERIDAVIVAPDERGLVSKAAAVLALNSLRVHSASVNVHQGVAITEFVVSPLFGSPPAAELVRQQFVGALNGDVDVLGMLQKRDSDAASLVSARAGDVQAGVPVTRTAAPPRILWLDTAAPAKLILEVRAMDRAGLLALLAGALEGAGAGIVWAKVNTFGSTAADVFCVTVPAELDARAAVEQHLLEVLGASVDVVVDEPVGD